MKDKEKIVLVAGTFDILHEIHVNMLKNAKNLGDRLIVMLSTDEFNWNEKSKKADRKSTRLNSSHSGESRMPSSA